MWIGMRRRARQLTSCTLAAKGRNMGQAFEIYGGIRGQAHG